MSLISYAQNGEDVLLWRALHDVAAGCYIDVGANDPELHSVTKAFYDHGWSGINIEPMPSYRDTFLTERPRDINLNVAAGASSGEITLFDVPAVNGWASTDQTVASAHRAHGHTVVEHRVPLRTLADICRQHVHGPVHFLKIDVEGHEADVLRGMDFRLYRPWIVVVEAMLPNSQDSNHGNWEALITDHDYQFAWFDGLNRYYVAAEHAELAPRLALQPNVFDDYLPHHLDKAWSRITALELQADQAWRQAQQHNEKAQEYSAQAQQAKAHSAVLQQAVELGAAQLRLALDETLQLRSELQQANTRITSLDSNLQQSSAWGQGLEQQLLAVYASTSWRWTAPLRALTRRGERSLWNLGRQRSRAAVLRLIRRLGASQAVRRTLLPMLLHFPALDTRVRQLLAGLKHSQQPAADVPHLLRELPLSARQVLADLRRAQQPTSD